MAVSGSMDGGRAFALDKAVQAASQGKTGGAHGERLPMSNDEIVEMAKAFHAFLVPEPSNIIKARA